MRVAAVILTLGATLSGCDEAGRPGTEPSEGSDTSPPPPPTTPDPIEIECGLDDVSTAVETLDGFASAGPSPLELWMRFGSILAAADTDLDGDVEVLVGTYEWPNYSVRAAPADPYRNGAAWLLDGADLVTASHWPGLEEHEVFGAGVAFGRVTGATVPDVIVYSWHAYFVLSADKPLDDPSTIVFEITAGSSGAYRPTAGDVTGDGAEDLLLVTYDGDSGGELSVIAGPVGGKTFEDAAVITQSGDRGVSDVLTVIDFDGDGVLDLAIADNNASDHAGSVNVLAGPVTDGADLLDAPWSWTGSSPDDWLGQVMVDGGDLDGDGTPELVVSAMAWPAGERLGRNYVLDATTTTLASAEVVIDGGPGVRHLGAGVAAADLDADGERDLALISHAPAAALSVYRGPLSGALTTGDADRMWVGRTCSDVVSAVVAGDVDGDGAVDLAIGLDSSDTYGDLSGEVMLLAGPL